MLAYSDVDTKLECIGCGGVMKKCIKIYIEMNSDNNIHEVNSYFALVQWFDVNGLMNTQNGTPCILPQLKCGDHQLETKCLFLWQALLVVLL